MFRRRCVGVRCSRRPRDGRVCHDAKARTRSVRRSRDRFPASISRRRASCSRAPGAKVSVDQQPLRPDGRQRGDLRRAAADVCLRDRRRRQLRQQSVFARRHRSRAAPDRRACGCPMPWPPAARISGTRGREDGANTGPFSSTAAFDVFTPIVIGAPVPASPIDNAMVGLGAPALYVQQRPATRAPSVRLSTSSKSPTATASGTSWPCGRWPSVREADRFSIRRRTCRPSSSCSGTCAPADPTTAGPWSADAGVPDAGAHRAAAAAAAGRAQRGPTPGDALNLGVGGRLQLAGRHRQLARDRARSREST